jgi:filamentous hemagglutinin
MKWSAEMFAYNSGGVNVDNEGNVTLGNLGSETGNINIKSREGSVNTTGVIQTKGINNDINLAAGGNITNTGQILGAGNININAGQTFNNSSTSLNLSNNNFTIQALNFINSGTLAASLDFNATVTNLNNSGSIVGGRNLSLTANQIINSNSVFANNKINITATDYLTNNKDIISLGTGVTDGITINAKTLNNNSRIAASKTVTINSSILNNNTANSIILALSDINLNAITIDNSNANIQAGNILTLRNLSLNAPDIANLFSVNIQNTSIANTNGSLYC